MKVPQEIFEEILGYADIDIRIYFGYIQKLRPNNYLDYRPKYIWNNDVMQWTYILPIHRQKQYVLVICQQMEWNYQLYMVDFKFGFNDLLYQKTN